MTLNLILVNQNLIQDHNNNSNNQKKYPNLIKIPDQQVHLQKIIITIIPIKKRI